MSQIHRGILGVLAVGLTVGAVQFASGHDLIGGQLTISAVPETVSAAPETIVNRAAKADRAEVRALGQNSQTIALKLDGLPDTSVLVRVPAAKEEARSRPAGPGLSKPGEGRKVACEPVVSVLTDVAKLLQPGRCIT
ncbi:hypothetical protein UP10_11930 [Bradyrhizobium sp. LTSPM299]|uniref:hypothetical protein n=1 Tax=Bradyrhizobium sp. LTSPM299 TaxID=1619233 RepID=UPI0005C8FA9C|nr:hypothetical protein [Bradyrhizobium sp. LTSPM299]KJC60594.1 hypothetical protein UP10_11930 [Bradyrhizobium sp. LTSPM299]